MRVWLCAKCEHLQAELPPFLQTEARILYVDIESSLTQLFGVWGLKVPNKYINPALLSKPYYVITWAASWIGESKIYSRAVTGRQARAGNDRQALRELWKLIDAADIVAGHNVNGFDLKKLRTRFMLNNMPKPRDFRTIDTLKTARSEFDLPSNSLESICYLLGLNPKARMELEDWIKIAVGGDEETIQKMLQYNKGDVREGKKVFERFSKWARYPAVPRGGYK